MKRTFTYLCVVRCGFVTIAKAEFLHYGYVSNMCKVNAKVLGGPFI